MKINVIECESLNDVVSVLSVWHNNGWNLPRMYISIILVKYPETYDIYYDVNLDKKLQ